MRVAGTVIWSTELKESSETSGGGKGKPKTTTYSYSASFAVALSSRPIESVGRIWADGNLLRGSAGDLKVGGQTRLYRGLNDQQPEPLITAAEGAHVPAFRDCAYIVFEDLELGDFGNRIPALTFEVFADSGATVSLVDLVPLAEQPELSPSLSHVQGFSDEGGPLAAFLGAIDRVIPFSSVASDKGLQISVVSSASTVLDLPEPLAQNVGSEREGQGGSTRRADSDREHPRGLRYYDLGRDYLPGVQRAIGSASAGREALADLPAALSSTGARSLANAMSRRSKWRGEQLTWPMASLDPSYSPGALVTAPGHSGVWIVIESEWSESGIDLLLERVAPTDLPDVSGDPGVGAPPLDGVLEATILRAFELPWDGFGDSNTASIFTAASAAGPGWNGAALFVDQSGVLIPLSPGAARRSVVGELQSALGPSHCTRLEFDASMAIDLAASDFELQDTTVRSLATGANRLLVGREVLQFLEAEQIGEKSWRLSGLLRGRGGTEQFAFAGHPIGSDIALINEAPIPLDPSIVPASDSTQIAAIGLGDDDPVLAQLVADGHSRRPLSPVHPRWKAMAGGGAELTWSRRARGQWDWPDTVDIPLVEESEQYEVGVADIDAPVSRWLTDNPCLIIEDSELASLQFAHPGEPIWVRQIGTFGPSPATLIATL